MNILLFSINKLDLRIMTSFRTYLVYMFIYYYCIYCVRLRLKYLYNKKYVKSVDFLFLHKCR